MTTAAELGFVFSTAAEACWEGGGSDGPMTLSLNTADDIGAGTGAGAGTIVGKGTMAGTGAGTTDTAGILTNVGSGDRATLRDDCVAIGSGDTGSGAG